MWTMNVSHIPLPPLKKRTVPGQVDVPEEYGPSELWKEGMGMISLTFIYKTMNRRKETGRYLRKYWLVSTVHHQTRGFEEAHIQTGPGSPPIEKPEDSPKNLKDLVERCTHLSTEEERATE